MTYETPHASLFRAYDVRGIVGEHLHETAVRAIGHAFASHVITATGVQHPRIVVARDGRHSSPALHAALIEGLLLAGSHVRDIGLAPTPMCYFATHHLSADASVMVTGSHNPPQHNGLKCMVGAGSLYGEKLASLRGIIANAALRHGKGNLQHISVAEDYISALLRGLLTDVNSLPGRIVWDAGNGAAGPTVEALCRALPNVQHQQLYCTPDGDFPNHHPDPSQPENMKDLQREVLALRAGVGFALDGDGDRLGVMDDKGRIVSPDHLLMLLARDVLQHTPGATIIADVKTSDAFFFDVRAHGGQPIMWSTGHALIKDKMHTTGAAFAGEASGHLFFADRYLGFDDGLYAAIRVLRILQQHKKPLSVLVDALPKLYTSQEFRIACDDAKKFTIIDAIRKELTFDRAEVNTQDGMRVSTQEGWWLLRASNTQAALVARCEGNAIPALAALTHQLAERLKRHGLKLR
jgi:phosphomannomutase